MRTFKFVLRWYWLPFLFGLALFGLGTYAYFGVKTPQAPAGLAVDSAAGLFGPWLFLFAAVFGAGVVVWAWLKGAQLAGG